MIELKITFDDIDYVEISDMVLPILREQMKEKGSILGDVFGKIPESMLKSTAATILKTLPQSQKDAIAVKIVEKYNDKIKGLFENTAKSKGVTLSVTELSVSQKNEL